MRDLWPSDCSQHRYIERVGAATVERFGYKEIRTPFVESCATFERSLGTTSDVVNKEMFLLERRERARNLAKGDETISLSGDSSKKDEDTLCLRPEQTACIMRAVVGNDKRPTLPQMLYYYGAMFRYERPQLGRLRQFHQFGVECLGVDNVPADVEVVLMAVEFLKDIGFDTQGLQLEVNTLGNSEDRARYSTALLEYLQQWVVDHKDSETALSQDSLHRVAEKRALRVLDSKHPIDQAAIAQAPTMHDYLDPDTLQRFQWFCEQLDKAGTCKFRIDIL